ncbi:hypothetical protein NPX13_g7877 [Xylaria arbuscula]|uniref:Uncharacterized protein n=1 Tax=Xylaria arbuscula TaxID=114810 RepID=A0A9W8TJ38_9PEZI|nr:hypothetical protein NPX13_g7877 [Xylaria arbuscula]
MGQKDHEADAAASSDISNLRDDVPRERRSKSSRSRLVKDKDSKDVHRHRSHRSSKLKTSIDADSIHSSSTHHRRHRTREEKERDRERKEKASSMNDLVPELTRTSTIAGSRVSLPYPSFNKAHSKEAVYSRDDLGASNHQGDPLTPDPTDLGSEHRRRSKSPERSTEEEKSSRKDDRPPSPPETDLASEKKRRSKTSTSRLRSDGSERPRSRVSSGVSRSSSRHEDKSKLSRSKSSSHAYGKSSTLKPPPGIQIMDETASGLSDDRTAGAQSYTTSVPPKRSASARSARMPSLDADDSPESVQDSSPKTPTATAQFPSPHVFPDESHTSSLTL